MKTITFNHNKNTTRNQMYKTKSNAQNPKASKSSGGLTQNVGLSKVSSERLYEQYLTRECLKSKFTYDREGEGGVDSFLSPHVAA